MINSIDEPWEYFLVFSLLGVLLAAILSPFICFLKPSPLKYYRFFQDTWNVYVVEDGSKQFRWMPHYFFVTGTSFFIGQAVLSTLHYPLLFTFGASVTEICILDAFSGLSAAVIDVMVRSAAKGKLSRSRAFFVAACLNATGYFGIIGCIMPRLSDQWGWAQRVAVFVTQTLAGLNLTFQEYAVMRNDWNEDIVSEMYGRSRQSFRRFWTSEEIGLKLAQLMVVCRYPATIVANFIFGSFVDSQADICSSYALLGILSFVHGIFLALCWRKHVPRKQRSAVKLRNDGSARLDGLSVEKAAPLIDMRPGGPYFRMASGIATYNAVLEVTRKGYVRLLNLCVLQANFIANSDLSLLVTITFSVSWCLFWLADISSNKVPDAALFVFKRIKHDEDALTGKMFVGIVSFSMMGLGHLAMGLANSFYWLLASAVFFGVGQATSTGLRTVIKDDMRKLLRSHQREEDYRKRLMRIVNGAATAVSIASSLLVASFGNNLGATSTFYACVAFLGAFLSLMDATNIRIAFQKKMESFRSAGVIEVDEDDEKMQALLGEQGQSEDFSSGQNQERFLPSWDQLLCCGRGR